MYVSYKFCPLNVNPSFAIISISINVYVGTIKLIQIVEFFILKKTYKSCYLSCWIGIMHLDLYMGL